MKLDMEGVRQAFSQFSGEEADPQGAGREAFCAALCSQCAQRVERLVRPGLSQEEETAWEGALEALAAAEAFYQLLLAEEAASPQSLSAGGVSLTRGAGSERAARLVEEKRGAVAPVLGETGFCFAAVGKGEKE